MNNLFEKIDKSFRAIMKGEEPLHNVIWFWGVIAYIFTYVVIRWLLKSFHYHWLEIFISILVTLYFAWHIYAVRKCQPKQPKLTKEQKKLQRIVARQEFAKKFMRKLLLKESITKWDPAFVAIVMDIYCITDFLGRVI